MLSKYRESLSNDTKVYITSYHIVNNYYYYNSH